MSEKPIPAGLGHKLFILPKDAVVGIGESLPPFTLREADLHFDIKEEPLVKPIMQSFKLESWGNSASLPTQGLNDWLDSEEGRKVTVTCFPSDSSLPRKMKKGNRATYRRDTKWKRKAAAWRWRNKFEVTGTMHFDDEGITITGKRG